MTRIESVLQEMEDTLAMMRGKLPELEIVRKETEDGETCKNLNEERWH